MCQQSTREGAVADLTDRLADVVSAELKRHASAIEAGVGRPKSVQVTIELGKGQRVDSVDFWIQHHDPVRAHLGLKER